MSVDCRSRCSTAVHEADAACLCAAALKKHMLLQLTFGGLAVGGALASVPVSMRGLCFTLPYLHGNGSVPGWTAKL